jgi:hypothetical protein
MMMELEHNRTLAAKFGAELGRVVTSAPVGACRAVGGTEQLSALIADSAGSDEVVRVSVCLSRPTDERLAGIGDALTNAGFS